MEAEQDIPLETLDSLEPVEDQVSAPADGATPNPKMYEPGWTQFLMGQLTEAEQHQNLPKVEGLRRLCHEFLGDVISSTSDVIQSPNVHNANHSCVKHNLLIECFDGKTRQYSGVADVFHGSGDRSNFEWCYSSATCETRAESRAYRRALRLCDIVTAEEVSNVPPDDSGANGLITDSQLNMIGLVCQRLNIDVVKYINLGKTSRGEQPYRSVKDVPYVSAVLMVAQLTKYQQDRDSIPASIRGHKTGWRGVS